MTQAAAIGRQYRSGRGLSAREAVLAAPLLVLCFLAVYDAVLCIESRFRLDRAALTIARALAASGRPVQADLPALLLQAVRLAEPSDVASGGLVLSLVDPIGRVGESVLWQRRAGPAASTTLALPRAATLSTDHKLNLIAELSAPPDRWIIGTSVLAAWFGDWSHGTGRVAFDAPPSTGP